MIGRGLEGNTMGRHAPLWGVGELSGLLLSCRELELES
jgi:hypothetical protein